MTKGIIMWTQHSSSSQGQASPQRSNITQKVTVSVTADKRQQTSRPERLQVSHVQDNKVLVFYTRPKEENKKKNKKREKNVPTTKELSAEFTQNTKLLRQKKNTHTQNPFTTNSLGREISDRCVCCCCCCCCCCC